MNTLGLDISRHYDDVARIVRAKFPVRGPDADDLVQDVCKKIVKLNNGSSPYDPSKASISHYIYLVTASVFSTNLRRKKKSPIESAVDFDAYSDILDADPVVTVDKDDLGILECEGFVAEFVAHVDEVLDPSDTNPRRLLMLTSMGYTKKEIAKILNVSFYRVDKDRKRLKEMAKDWMKARRN